MIRRHIVFYGWVQGVGFRYRARHAADLYSCTGWGKNEWDGSVTMEIQGEEDNIDRVILAIERGTYVRIENMNSRMIPVEPDARNFGIRYHDLPEGADDSFFLCKELIPGYLDDVTGVYQTPKGYYVDDADVEEFDKAFPPKAKLKLPGQIFD